MKNRQIPKKLSAFLLNQDGAIGIVILLLLPILFGFAGLAVDMGHSYAVKSQLKNAADAGALSGARALVPYTGFPSTPNWIGGQNKAPQTVELNRADNNQLTDSEVTYGYWSFTTSPPSLQSAGISPTLNDFPAVRVTVSKTAGKWWTSIDVSRINVGSATCGCGRHVGGDHFLPYGHATRGPETHGHDHRHYR